jgi:CBS domain containing-hemolysin-like protein
VRRRRRRGRRSGQTGARDACQTRPPPVIVELLGIVAVLLLTAGTALFVAAEFSLVAVERPQLEAAEREGDTGAGRVLQSVRTLSFQLSGAQLGITMTTLVVGFIAEPAFAAFVGPPLRAVGLPEGAVAGISLGVALLVATVLQIVFGELVPKNLAIARPLPVARTVAGPLRLFSALLRPLIAACNSSANAVVRRLGIEPQEELRSARSASELGSLVRSSAEEGTLTEQTATMLTRSLAFGDRNAGDVMTPRMRMTTLEQGESVARLLEVAHESGHSRFPVEGSGVDDIIGVVHVKKAFAVPREERRRTRVSQVMGPVVRVPESVHLDDLLPTLREPGLQMAVVIDEYEGTAGVVTLEDLVEELVGEVDDEHDAPSRPDVEHRPDDTLVLSGLLRDDQVAEVSDFALPEGPYDTLGGLVMQQLGRVPHKGDTTEVDGWTLTVLEVDGRRVDRVQLTPPPAADESGDAA